QRGAARSRRAGAVRPGPVRPPRRLAPGADRGGCRTPGGQGVTETRRVKLKPGDTIGILGGGQLGRMLAMAAARLGLRCQVFSPDPDSPALHLVVQAARAQHVAVQGGQLVTDAVVVITYQSQDVPAAAAMT